MPATLLAQALRRAWPHTTPLSYKDSWKQPLQVSIFTVSHLNVQIILNQCLCANTSHRKSHSGLTSTAVLKCTQALSWFPWTPATPAARILDPCRSLQTAPVHAQPLRKQSYLSSFDTQRFALSGHSVCVVRSALDHVSLQEHTATL